MSSLHGKALKIVDIKALHGAGYFSGRPVIVLRLDLGKFDEVFTNEIDGFYENLKAVLPSLEEHHCSIGEKGGFFQRVRNGTLLGHVTEHVAIELQTLAGMDVSYGKTRSTATQGVYNVVFRFFDEMAGREAARAAVDLVEGAVAGKPFPVQETVDRLVEIRESRLLGPSTQAIIDEAARRGIPWFRLDDYNLVQLGTGRYKKTIRATVTSDTSQIAVETAADKFLTATMLSESGVPVPPLFKTDDPEAAVAFFLSLGVPAAIKPSVGKLGEGVSLDVDSPAAVRRAVALALEHDGAAVVQPCLEGDSFRLLVIDFRFVAAVRLTPPVVTGDGTSSVAELVDALNSDPDRGIGDKSRLTRVDIDAGTVRLLRERDLTPDSVLPEGLSLALKSSGNPKLGGSSEDVTDLVHPVNRMLAERASRTLGLNAAGVDIVAPRIDRSILENPGAVIEVNAGPDFRMHLTPSMGQGRDVARPFVEMLFPESEKTRVPVFAVTGSAGKTTTVELIDHCLRAEGWRVAAASSRGLHVSGEPLIRGDVTGHESASMALRDALIDCAVIEVPVETIVNRGLGYEFADFGIVLNVVDEGLVLDSVEGPEDVAYAKSVVAEQVYDEGYSILNADSELVLEMRGRLYSRLVLFSTRRDNPEVARHAAAGERAVIVDSGRVIVLDGHRTIDLIGLDEIPLAGADGGGAHIENIVAAAAALYFFGLSVDHLAASLRSFRIDGADDL